MFDQHPLRPPRRARGIDHIGELIGWHRVDRIGGWLLCNLWRSQIQIDKGRGGRRQAILHGGLGQE